MDEAEDRMWWFRPPCPPVRRPEGHPRPGARRRLRHRRLARRFAPQRPDLIRFGIEWDASGGRTRPRQIRRGDRRAAASMPCPSPIDSFDAAVCADVLCHAAVDPAVALAELKRVLRPGGRLVVNMPAYQWLLSAHDRQRPQRPPPHRAGDRRDAASGRLRPRASAILERPAAAADDRCSEKSSRVATLCPMSPRFRHGSMPHCMA